MNRNSFNFALYTYQDFKVHHFERKLNEKGQGPSAGLMQAVVLLGGNLEVDEDGFSVDFNEAY